MGMFDFIKCYYPLPDGFNPTESCKDDAQTKSLDRGLHKYTITKDGKLTCSILNYDAEYEKDEPVNYTGEVRFYYYEKNISKEYIALFVNGQLINLLNKKE